MLIEFIIKEFINKVFSNDFVFGGGSVLVFNGVFVILLVVMVVNFIIGCKKYVEVNEIMEDFFVCFEEFICQLIIDVDCDLEVYDCVFFVFKFLKEMDEEKVICSEVIQKEIKYVV